MNVYQITFTLKDGTTIDAELVTPVTLPTDFWTIAPAGNGTLYSGYPGGNPPAPTWSAVPNFLNQNASLSVNILTTYLTPTSGVTCVLNGSLPTGWSFNGTTLSYNGTSVNSSPTTGLTFTATDTATGLQSTCNAFSVQGSGTPVTDTIAPTIPLAIAASAITATTATLGGYQSSDPSVAGQTTTGMAQYNVTVTGATGSPFTVSSGGVGTEPVFTLTDVGPQTSSLSQSGADLTITTTAIDNPYPTNSAVGGGGFQITGTSWLASCEIDAFTSGNAFDNLRMECRPSLSATDAYAAIYVLPTNHAAGAGSDCRTASGGSAAGIANATLSGLPVRLFMQRSGDTYTFSYSVNGNNPIALGTTTQVMGSTVYVIFGGNCGAAGTVSGTIKQTNVQALAPWTLNLTGLTAATTYPVTVTAQDVAGNISAASASTSFTTSTASGGLVFPMVGVQAITGAQTFASTAVLKLLAQYQWVAISGRFPSWVGSQSSASGGSLPTRDSVVQGLKSFTGSGGKNAVLPLVGQYENMLDFLLSSPPFPEWAAAVASNNWYLYVSGSSGTKATSAGGAGQVTVNPAHVVGADAATGLFPMGLAAKLMYERYHDGTLTGGSAMASTHLDFYYMDDMPARNIFGGPADPLRNGTNPSQTDPTATSATATGKADYCTWLAANASSILRYANSEHAYDYSLTSLGGLGMAPNATSGIYQGTMQQFMYGSSGGANNILSGFGSPSVGFAAFMKWYQTLDANGASGSQSVLTGGVNSTDYQTVRYSLCATLMRNGIAVYGLLDIIGSASDSDLVDPTNTASFPTFDEFWGGSLNLAAYLGARVGGVQTAAWSGSIWRAVFANGRAYVNPTGSAVTITFGETLWHLRGTQVPSINSGASATTYDCPAYDGVIMLTSAPP